MRTAATNPSCAVSSVTFRLRVRGMPPRGTTFWVAYGPLCGHFGVIELQPAGPRLYEATRRLPARGRTTLAYLSAVGHIKTRFGLAPGNPVTTIHLAGPGPLARLARPTIEWQVPVG
ncbi:MAG TPA: hypothetical protein VF221_22485 [Chloroflexota bacterium]